MSWFIEFHARNKGEAKAELSRCTAINSQFPVSVAQAIMEQVELLPPEADAVVHVKTTGHIDPSREKGGYGQKAQGRVECVVELITLANPI